VAVLAFLAAPKTITTFMIVWHAGELAEKYAASRHSPAT
jgi:hypothetical protein